MCIRDRFGADDMLLGVPSVLFQPVLHIGCVGVDKALKGCLLYTSCSSVGSPALLLQKKGSVCRTQQTIRAGDHIEFILRLLLASVMNNCLLYTSRG